MVEFLVGLFFGFVSGRLDGAVVVLSFLLGIFGSGVLALFVATFAIDMLASVGLSLFFILIRFW